MSLLALFSFVTGSYPAMLHAPQSDASIVYVAGAVAATAMSVAFMTLWQAAGKPALQALAGAIMLASSLASSAAWPYSPWCSALAAVPLLLAGKQHASAAMAPACCSRGSRLTSKDNRLPHCRAGAMCVSNDRPVAAVPLSKAAFAACLVYTQTARLCLKNPGAVNLVSLIVPAAVNGAFLPNQYYDGLAWLVLPPAMYAHLHHHGLQSGAFGRAAVGGWKEGASHLPPASSQLPC